MMRIGILSSHPIQYEAPLFRRLAQLADIHVYFAHNSTAVDQAKAGYDVPFEWDIDLLSGYQHTFLSNRAQSPNLRQFSGCDTPEIADYIYKGHFDAFIVTGWFLKSYWQAIRACKRYNVPILVRGDSQLGTKRSLLKRLIKKILYRWVIKQFDGFLVVGKNAEEYVRHYDASTEHIFQTPHFVDVAWFKQRSKLIDRVAFREKLGIKPNEIVLLFVGRLVDFKRPLDIVYALSELKSSSIQARALFVGSGKLAKNIASLAKKLNVSVSLAGFKNQTELPSYYTVSDLLILSSSSSETWGLVVNESFACGTPAIVSDAVGCAPDMIEESKTGFSYPVGNIQALSQAIIKMIPQLTSTEVYHAIEQKNRYFSVDTTANAIIDAVTTIIKTNLE